MVEDEQHEEHPRLAALAAALAIGALLGALIGFGGKGFGGGSPGGDKGPCRLRLDSQGLWRDGSFIASSPLARPALDVAIGPCSEAKLTVTGDARSGDYEELKDALDDAQIPYTETVPH